MEGDAAVAADVPGAAVTAETRVVETDPETAAAMPPMEHEE